MGTFLLEEAETCVNADPAFNPSLRSLNGAFERPFSSHVNDDGGDEEALCCEMKSLQDSRLTNQSCCSRKWRGWETEKLVSEGSTR